MSATFRPFGADDWELWAGAANLVGGAPPLIAEGVVPAEDWPEDLTVLGTFDDTPPALVCILDGDGVGFWGLNGGFTKDLPYAEAHAVATQLLAAPRVSAWALHAMGFTACNLPEPEGT